MLRRKVYDKLIEWKNRKHKCLLLSGQRQVGKTFIVREFARNEYEYLAELNFASMGEAHGIFKGDRDIDSIILRWNVLYPDMMLVPGKTLLFLDEIQDCDEAFSSLKQFTADGRFDVIASGSLLGVRQPKLKKRQEETQDEKSALVPMGSEENLVMYGLDFEEFLWARKIGQSVIDTVKKCIRDKTEIDPLILNSLNQYYREFMIVGGMPEAVSAYIEDGDFVRVKKILSDLRVECLRDINRYNRGVDIVKTSECFESIPHQLAENNKKFMYSRIRNEQSRQASDKYMENLLWIKGAGYGNFCYGLDAPVLPLKDKKTVFKVYLSDTGMLVNMYGDNCIKAIYSKELNYNFGAITENAVAEGLRKAGYEPKYFTEQKGEKRMELDFIIENGNGIVVIEVKSGKDRTAPSISKAVRFYDLPTRIILSEENIFCDGNGVMHMPLFAAGFIGELEPTWDGPRIN